MATRKTISMVYGLLLNTYGPQNWWPGDTPFEIMIGAILTQSTSWQNVEKAIHNLRSANALSPDSIRKLTDDNLASLIYPSGYYNAKTKKLKALAKFIGENFDDDIEAMANEPQHSIREALMKVHGIGDETADSIILYAIGLPAFVIDTYTKRIFDRLHLSPPENRYSNYRNLFTQNLPKNPKLFNEYHALIVRHGRETCKKTPVCERCCLLQICPTGYQTTSKKQPT